MSRTAKKPSLAPTPVPAGYAPDHWQRMLTRLRIAHADRTPHAARDALRICAAQGIVMPRWLADLVEQAIVSSRRGIADDVFGIGNGALLMRWRRQHKAAWHDEIREAKKLWQAVGIKHVNEFLVGGFHTSGKNIEKITNRRKNPTRKAKK